MAVTLEIPGSPPIKAVCDTVSEAIAFIKAVDRPRVQYTTRKAPPTEATIADRIGAWLCRKASLSTDPAEATVLSWISEQIRAGAYWPALDETRKPKSKTA
jgi:hypothetical protein